ncbi:hypothetical protein IGI04_007065, partial [Brassica rapa subsp. trilocularis]
MLSNPRVSVDSIPKHKEWKTQSTANHRSTETRFHRSTLSQIDGERGQPSIDGDTFPSSDVDIAQIDDNALSDTDNYLDEGTNCSDPYSVLHVDSFIQAYDTAVKSRTGRERFNIRQALTGHRKTKLEFYGKINMVYGELMEKADSLGELIRKLEGQVAEIATAIKRDAGCLPGRTDLNPRRQVRAVMLRSGKNLAADTRNNTDAKEKAIDLELEEDTEIEDEIDRQYGTNVDRSETPTIDRQPEKPVDRRISDRTDDYMRLMDASIKVANVEENEVSEVVIDRYLQDTVDRQPPSQSN